MSKNLPKLLILTLIFAFLIFGLFLGTFYLTEQNCMNISQSIVKSDADGILDRIEADFEENKRIITEVADMISKMDFIDEPKIKYILDRFDAVIRADHIHVLLPGNRIIPEENIIVPIEKAFLDFDSFAQSGDYSSVIGASTCIEGENVIRQYVPVVKNGKTIAVVYSVTYCSAIADYFILEDFRSSFIISLVERKSGNFIYNSSKFSVSNIKDLPITKGKNGVIQQKIINDILSGNSGNAQYMDYQFQEKLQVLYKPLEFNDWEAVMSVNQKSFLNEFYKKQAWVGVLFIIGMFAFLVYVLVIFFETQNFEKRLENHEDLLRKISQMDKDSRAKSAFLYNMSHDIRTPLNAIIGFSRIAKNNISNAEKLDETINKISVAGDMLSDILNNVLDMSSLDSGNFYLDEAPLNLNRMLNDITVLVQNQADDKNIRFTTELRGILDENLFVDGMRLKQILMNLISNSISLTKNGGNVSLKIEQITASSEEHAYFKFTVSDNGIGLRPELVEKLLDRDSEKLITKEDEREIGVNLLTTKRLLEFMSGNMTIVSKIGSGMVISFQIPIKILPEPQLYNVFVHEDEVFHLNGKRILLVEDNEMNREIAHYILEENQLVVEEAASGDVALKMINENAEGYYDAILLDLHMPYLDGYGTAKEIRSLNNTEKACIPIVAMTSSLYNEEKRKAGQAGMNGFVMKPLKVRELLTALQNVIVN